MIEFDTMVAVPTTPEQGLRFALSTTTTPLLFAVNVQLGIPPWRVWGSTPQNGTCTSAAAAVVGIASAPNASTNKISRRMTYLLPLMSGYCRELTGAVDWGADSSTGLSSRV